MQSPKSSNSQGGDPSEKVAFRINEWCSRTGMTRGAVYLAEKRKELRIVRIGKAAFIPASEITRIFGKSA
jgi:hypothetical protein